MLPYRAALLDTLELHTEQEVHIPFGYERTCSDVEGPVLLRSLHSCHHSSGSYLADTLMWNEYLVTGINKGLNFVCEYLYQRYFVFRNSIDSKL